jgi:hypothetical protein
MYSTRRQTNKKHIFNARVMGVEVTLTHAASINWQKAYFESQTQEKKVAHAM